MTLLQCVEDISAWAHTYYSSLEQAKNESDVAMEVYERIQPTCDTAQHAYEGAFCQYRESLTGTCADYTECYNKAVVDEADELPKVKATEEQFNTEYRTVNRIICLVRVLQGVMENQKGLLDGCLNATYPTDHLNITYNETVPANASCDTSNVTIHPCSDDWLNNEYTSQEWYVAAHLSECVPCAGSEAQTIVAASQYDTWACQQDGSRVFDLRDSGATVEGCSDACLAVESCVAFSGVWDLWCIGCNATTAMTLQNSATPNAEGFVKT